MIQSDFKVFKILISNSRTFNVRAKSCIMCQSVSYFCVSIWVCSGMFWIYSKGAQRYRWFSAAFELFWLCMHDHAITYKVLTAKLYIILYFHKFTFEVHDFSLVFLPHSCLPETDNLVSWVGCQGGHTPQLPNVGLFLREIESSVATFEHFQPRRTAV